jgi:hypothetical protein
MVANKQQTQPKNKQITNVCSTWRGVRDRVHDFSQRHSFSERHTDLTEARNQLPPFDHPQIGLA